MTTSFAENPAETLKNIRERAEQLDALEQSIAAERRQMAEVRARLCGVAAPLPDCTEVIEGVSLETTGNIEYPFALQVNGTLVEVDDADYCPGDLVNATVTRAFSAAELRTLGQALLTAAERLDPAPARTSGAKTEIAAALLRGVPHVSVKHSGEREAHYLYATGTARLLAEDLTRAAAQAEGLIRGGGQA
ncbi:hypothetical protein [Deinococcus wulumuqiensis]|uniref:hypothetical protein n=1 Tax=Deinococcus wulumuqiensis TaxID=980427 RepID=UPI002430DF72|nr:hypothetical protein [Deinococcus wulumuqiensis]